MFHNVSNEVIEMNDKISFPNNCLATLNWLNVHAPESYLVGGFLRDNYLQRITHDLDVAVPKNARDIAQKCANFFDAPFVVLDEHQHIYRVILNHAIEDSADTAKNKVQIDISQFKGEDIYADLSRRDFTINALALPISKLSWSDVVDPHEGLKDIQQKIIRSVSSDIFEDDPLRLLRLFRLSAQLGFTCDNQTLTLATNQINKIHRSSPERIREELLQILEVSPCTPHLKVLDQVGLLTEIFPEIIPNKKCALDYYPGKGVWGHTLDGLTALDWMLDHLSSEFPKYSDEIEKIILSQGEDCEGHTRIAIMRLGLMLHDIGKAQTAQVVGDRLRFFQHEIVGAKMARDIAKRLRFSHQATKKISTLVHAHMRPGGLAHAPVLTEKAKFRFFRDLDIWAIPMLLVSLADRYSYILEEKGQGKDLHEVVTKEMIDWYYGRNLHKNEKKIKLIDGHILMQELHLVPGPHIGKILREGEEAIGAGEVTSPEAALQYAREILRNQSG